MSDNSTWLIKAFVIIGFFSIAVLVAVLLNMKRAFDAKAEKNKIKYLYSLVPVICIILVIISWVSNFGFVRLKLTMQSVPLIHALALLIINLYAVKKADNSKVLRRILSAQYITYTAAYIIMPDIAEMGKLSAIFGLVENLNVIEICNSIYPALFTANIIFMIGTVIATISAKEKFTIPEKKKSNYAGGKKSK